MTMLLDVDMTVESLRDKEPAGIKKIILILFPFHDCHIFVNGDTVSQIW